MRFRTLSQVLKIINRTRTMLSGFHIYCLIMVLGCLQLVFVVYISPIVTFVNRFCLVCMWNANVSTRDYASIYIGNRVDGNNNTSRLRLILFLVYLHSYSCRIATRFTRLNANRCLVTKDRTLYGMNTLKVVDSLHVAMIFQNCSLLVAS